MQRRTFLLGFAGAAATACGLGGGPGPKRPIAPGALEPIEFEFEGQQRRSVVYMPKGHGNKKLPLVLALHGNNQTPEMMYERNRWKDTCEKRGFVGLFPHCNLPKDHPDAIGDTHYLVHMIERIAAQQAVDTQRIYAVGFSGGGKSCYQLAARHSDLVSAIAVCSSRIGHRGMEDHWEPRKNRTGPVSVLHIHGRKDTTIPIRGGHDKRHDMDAVGMREGLEMWARHNGCNRKNDATPRECPDRVTPFRWTSPEGHVVMGLTDPRLGHEWADWANPVVADFLAEVS